MTDVFLKIFQRDNPLRQGLADGLSSARYVLKPDEAKFKLYKRSAVPTDVRGRLAVRRSVESVLKSMTLR